MKFFIWTGLIGFSVFIWGFLLRWAYNLFC